MKNLLIVHGGGPTAVINSSLFGAIKAAKEYKEIDNIYGSIGGIFGILNNQYIDLKKISDSDLELLKTTPGSAIGTGRDHLEEEDYKKIVSALLKKDFKYVLINGGNGSMDTAKTLSLYCRNKGIIVVGIPKTMDNDLSITDHSPGYPSAARFIAGSVKEVAQDVKGLAIHVVVIEVFGRDTGWIAAASALARENNGDAPHMILYPEVPFDEDFFLKRVKKIYEEKGCAVIIASEGLRYKNKKPIVEPIFSVDRSVYFGDVSSHLAQLITKKLGIKARSEKPGILSRASSKWASLVDINEAILCGKKAVELALENKSSFMPVIIRKNTDDYQIEIQGVEICDEILKEKVMPEEFLDKENFDVSEKFINWLRPLVKPELKKYISFIK